MTQEEFDSLETGDLIEHFRSGERYYLVERKEAYLIAENRNKTVHLITPRVWNLIKKKEKLND